MSAERETAKVDWEGLFKAGAVGLGKVAVRGGRAFLDSVAGDVEKGIQVAESKTKKFRSALKKALDEMDGDDE